MSRHFLPWAHRSSPAAWGTVVPCCPLSTELAGAAAGHAFTRDRLTRCRRAYSPVVISPSALRGYVLEELLAGLLKGSGFDLLVAEAQDPAALCAAGNGLRIRGRGADHQVDVLGQLRMRIPFSLPVRLFVEAKFRGSPSGLADVRNALGVLNDVNEHYSTAAAQASSGPYERYQYRYALFSASGFTADAQLFAVAQQISLIDLRGPAFSWLLAAASRAAEALLALADANGVTSFPVNQMREAMRRALGTWPLSDPLPPDDFAEAASRARMASGTPSEKERLPPDALGDVLAQAADLDGTLLLAFTASPFALVVQPDDPTEAAELLASAGSTQSAELVFAGPDPATCSEPCDGLRGGVGHVVGDGRRRDRHGGTGAGGDGEGPSEVERALDCPSQRQSERCAGVAFERLAGVVLVGGVVEQGLDVSGRAVDDGEGPLN